MMDEKDEASLSDEEKAYFDSRGESEIKVDDGGQAAGEPEKAEPPAQDQEGDKPGDKAAQEQVEGGEPKMVPLAALTKTRQSEREAKQRAAELERLNQTLVERIGRALAPPEEQKPAADEVPDENDPAGRLNWLVEQMTRQRRAEAERDTQSQRQQAEDQALSSVNIALGEAKRTDPTLQDAHDAIRQSRGRELIALGYSPEAAFHQIGVEERQIGLYIAANKLDVAEYIKNWAQARGWTPKPPEKPQQKVDDGKQIAALAKAVDGSTSLSSAGGKAPGTIDAEAIANMSADEFEAWFAKPDNKKRWERLARSGA